MVWTSGVFDVLLVTWILAAGIAITSATNRNVQTIATAILTIAALVTKETAVVLPALLAIAAYASPSVTLKGAAIPIAASMVVVGLYVVVRVAAGFGMAPPSGEFTGYAAKELFSRPFGGLGLPIHIEVLSRRGPGWYFDFATFSFQTPTCVSLCANAGAIRMADKPRQATDTTTERVVSFM